MEYETVPNVSDYSQCCKAAHHQFVPSSLLPISTTLILWPNSKVLPSLTRKIQEAFFFSFIFYLYNTELVMFRLILFISLEELGDTS